jgi:hypothetical protein
MQHAEQEENTIKDLNGRNIKKEKKLSSVLHSFTFEGDDSVMNNTFIGETVMRVINIAKTKYFVQRPEVLHFLLLSFL